MSVNEQDGCQWLDVPNVNVTCVEFPGVVKNVDNALRSLGGGDDLENAITEERAALALRVQPNDLFRRPVMSFKRDSKDLLLSVKVPKRTGRKRKRGSNDPFTFHSHEDSHTTDRLRAVGVMGTLKDEQHSYSVDVLGNLTTTHRFRSLPDFQYSTATSGIAKSMEKHILPLSFPKIQDFGLDLGTKGLVSGMDMVPPPDFAMARIPYQYAYEQAMGVRAVGDMAGSKKVVNVFAHRKIRMHNVPYDEKTIPTQPMPDIDNESTLDAPYKTVVDRLRELLEQRPILTRRYFLCKLKTEQITYLKYAAQYSAYSFRSGPWRDCIIKFGVDPRLDCKYAQFQAMEFHVEPARGQAPLWMRSRRGGSRYGQKKTEGPRGYIFDGKSYSPRGRTWQMCDIVDPFIRPFLERPLRVRCDIKSYGWLQSGTLATVRAVMKDKLTILAAGEVPDNSPYQVLAGLPDKVTSSDINALALDRQFTPKEQTIVTDFRRYIQYRTKYLPDLQGPSFDVGSEHNLDEDAVDDNGAEDDEGSEDGSLSRTDIEDEADLIDEDEVISD
ncbi:MAG: tau 95 subunit of transcription factor TFIIIC [Chrysothrix sp. TS-e1954]|nr:MAG: tau 95 subunit of transcription factor TFIIIC [Chrysothrix sp. TS-e1954]